MQSNVSFFNSIHVFGQIIGYHVVANKPTGLGASQARARGLCSEVPALSPVYGLEPRPLPALLATFQDSEWFFGPPWAIDSRHVLDLFEPGFRSHNLHAYYI